MQYNSRHYRTVVEHKDIATAADDDDGDADGNDKCRPNDSHLLYGTKSSCMDDEKGIVGRYQVAKILVTV